MDKAVLERMLGDGMSLERIGATVGKDHSTVGYWVKKHGLRAVGSEGYSSKGMLDRTTLAELVEAGLTVREIAARMGVGVNQVRYWLQRHGFRTRGMRARGLPKNTAPRPRYVTRRCINHGEARFVLEGRGYYRCCNAGQTAVAKQRRKVKRLLIAEAGGSCNNCGYDRCQAALQFHHLDPTTKSFSLSLRGVTRSLDSIRAEAQKCVLLCANCHAEVEAGVTLVTTPRDTLQS